MPMPLSVLGCQILLPLLASFTAIREAPPTEIPNHTDLNWLHVRDTAASGLPVRPLLCERSGGSRPHKRFGDKTRFTLESDLMLGVVRSYPVFGCARGGEECRVFAGIHFRSATEDGVKLGADVAHYVLENKFQRIH